MDRSMNLNRVKIQNTKSLTGQFYSTGDVGPNLIKYYCCRMVYVNRSLHPHDVISNRNGRTTDTVLIIQEHATKRRNPNDNLTHYHHHQRSCLNMSEIYGHHNKYLFIILRHADNVNSEHIFCVSAVHHQRKPDNSLRPNMGFYQSWVLSPYAYT